MKKKKWTTTPYFIIFSIITLSMALISFKYQPVLGYIELVVFLVSVIAVVLFNLRFNNYVTSVIKHTAENITNFNSDYLDKYKVPIAIVGGAGDIVWCNTRFKKSFCDGRNPLGDAINSYIGDKSIESVADKESFETACNGREFAGFVVSNKNEYICYFVENTYYKQIFREYNATRPCVAIVSFDNSDTFFNMSDEAYSETSLSVQLALQKWASDYNALFKIIGNNRYMIIFTDKDVDNLVNEKFDILQQIHGIRYNQYRATISVGICRGVNSFRESEINAKKALDMALGRGGDQVAVLTDNTYEFFGGTSATSEKVSKVRMRVIANAIKRTIVDCDKVYIMGHRFSDLDSVGSAVAMQSVMQKTFGIKSKIVINREKTMAQKLISYADENIGKDIFTTPEHALRHITQKTLLVIVDTHLRGSLESSELYDKSKNVIVIDHHRKSVNYIDNASVFCHEPFASSTCEMCSEIISCIDDNAIGYAQADALLAGIMLDTKNFVVKTGVRTFEAAAYLRKHGANTLRVKQMFSDTIDTYRQKVDIVCNAEIYKECAISVANNDGEGDIRLASAQAADELLSLEGVKSSFVIFSDSNKINISARSYGLVNVQIMMEKLGGGGHQNMAATQLENSSKEFALVRLKNIIDSTFEDASRI